MTARVAGTWRPPRDVATVSRLLPWVVSAALILCTPVHGGAQWSASPVLAVGPAIPAGKFRDAASEGAAIKLGLWMRAPSVPVGVTSEALLVQFGGGATRDGLNGARVAALTANVTTRRHDRRLDLYGIAGAGWYWMDRMAPRYLDRQAPGFNVGVGEVVALGSTDFFVELRLHAVRATRQTGEGWMTFMPLLVGARF